LALKVGTLAVLRVGTMADASAGQKDSLEQTMVETMVGPKVTLKVEKLAACSVGLMAYAHS